MDKLTFEDLYIGLKVININKEIGTIKQINDICNIYVEYDNGWIEVHCLDINSKIYEPLWIY